MLSGVKKKNNMVIPNNKLSIPIPLIEYCIQEKILKPFKLYVILKRYSNGHYKIGGQELINVYKKYYSRSTYNDYKKILLGYGFIWVNRNKKILHIKSYEYVLNKLKLFKTSRVKFIPYDLNNWQEFCFSAVVINEIRRKRRYDDFVKSIRSNSRRAGSKKWEPNIPSDYISPKYFGLSSSLIQEVTRYSKTRVSRLKQLSMESSYLIIEPKFKPLFDISPDEVKGIRKYNPNYGRKLIVDKNLVFEQMYDEIWTEELEIYSQRVKKIF